MTAALDIAISRTTTPDIAAQCRAVTLDLRPGLVGPVAAPRAPLQLPDLDSCEPSELSDLAANAYDDSGDLDVLTRSSPHVRAICRMLGRAEMAADRDRDRIALLENNVRILSQQLEAAQGIGQSFKSKVEELTAMLTAERHRVTREVSAHGKTVEMLTTTLLHEFRQRNRAERLEEQLNEERILRVAALQDLEDMRRVAIARGEEAAELRRGKS